MSSIKIDSNITENAESPLNVILYSSYFIKTISVYSKNITKPTDTLCVFKHSVFTGQNKLFIHYRTALRFSPGHCCYIMKLLECLEQHSECFKLVKTLRKLFGRTKKEEMG